MATMRLPGFGRSVQHPDLPTWIRDLSPDVRGVVATLVPLLRRHPDGLSLSGSVALTAQGYASPHPEGAERGLVELRQQWARGRHGEIRRPKVGRDGVRAALRRGGYEASDALVEGHDAEMLLARRGDEPPVAILIERPNLTYGVETIDLGDGVVGEDGIRMEPPSSQARQLSQNLLEGPVFRDPGLRDVDVTRLGQLVEHVGPGQACDLFFDGFSEGPAAEDVRFKNAVATALSLETRGAMTVRSSLREFAQLWQERSERLYWRLPEGADPALVPDERTLLARLNRKRADDASKVGSISGSNFQDEVAAHGGRVASPPGALIRSARDLAAFYEAREPSSFPTQPEVRDEFRRAIEREFVEILAPTREIADQAKALMPKRMEVQGVEARPAEPGL